MNLTVNFVKEDVVGIFCYKTVKIGIYVNEWYLALSQDQLSSTSSVDGTTCHHMVRTAISTNFTFSNLPRVSKMPVVFTTWSQTESSFSCVNTNRGDWAHTRTESRICELRIAHFQEVYTHHKRFIMQRVVVFLNHFPGMLTFERGNQEQHFL